MIQNHILLSLSVLAGLPGSIVGQTVIEGRVALPKTHSAPVMNKRYEILSVGGVLAPNPPIAVVYLEGKFASPVAQPFQQLIQTNFTFVPALLPVQVGTKVEFPNFDTTFHNVFSYSPAKRFDLGRYRPDERPIPTQVFDKPGLVTLRCDIHEHMRGLILVLDTPHFTITDSEGRFRLTNLPPGDFVLKAWVNSKTTREVSLKLGTNATVRIDLP